MSDRQPLVSVIMPCYNSSRTLPMALASLLGQTYPNWECLVVDDGSTDGTAEMVKSVQDSRFRLIRLEHNQGRGAARQRGNHEAGGDLVAMLDADDWWYSTKLKKQLRFLQDHPEIKLVSAGIVIADAKDECLGYRCCQPIAGETLKSLVNPPIAWAPVLIRAEVAKGYSFNARYRASEDSDYLQRICLKEKFANLPEPLYVYREYQDYNWKKVSLSMRYRLHALSLLWPQYPYQASREIAKYLAKFTIYALAFLAGQHHRLVARRSNKPTPQIMETFLKERAEVQALAKQIAPQNL